MSQAHSTFCMIDDAQARVKDARAAGALWGLDNLGVKSLYYDKHSGRHYIFDIIDGMCGQETKITYIDIPKDGLVTVGGYQYRAKLH